MKFLSRRGLAIIAVLALFLLPQYAFADDLFATEEGITLHRIYEIIVGPLGAVIGIFSIFMIHKLSKKFGGIIGKLLGMIVIAIIFEVVASIAFGVHGFGWISGENLRYIERLSRLITLTIIGIGAYIANKKEEKEFGGVGAEDLAKRGFIKQG